MKVLFLDIDGVLNHLPIGVKVSHRAVRLLNEVYKETGCEIVISSNWRRRMTPQSIKRVLKAKGLKGKLIGATPVLYDAKGHYPRGDEVKAWLAGIDNPKWPRTMKQAVERFAILDDGNDFGDLEPYRVQPDPHFGITQENVEDLVSILGRKRQKRARKHRMRYTIGRWSDL